MRLERLIHRILARQVLQVLRGNSQPAAASCCRRLCAQLPHIHPPIIAAAHDLAAVRGKACADLRAVISVTFELQHDAVALKQPQPAVVCGDEELLRLTWHSVDACDLLATRVLPTLVPHVNLQRSQCGKTRVVIADARMPVTLVPLACWPRWLRTFTRSAASAARQIKPSAVQSITAGCKLEQARWRNSMP
jgi:hypothetical protein